MQQNLQLFVVRVFRIGHPDSAENIEILAPTKPQAQRLACDAYRSRFALPTSVALMWSDAA